MPLYYQGLTETVSAYVVRGDRLLYRLQPKVERGLTIYRIDGVWAVGRDVPDETTALADRVYYGGYVYTVPDTELLEMEAQGVHASVARDVFVDEFTETF